MNMLTVIILILLIIIIVIKAGSKIGRLLYYQLALNECFPCLFSVSVFV